MAKSVLISIRPQWVEKIFNGSKTIEVRRTFPKQLETPFEVYVYCTKERMTRVPSMYAYLHKNEPGACAEYGTIETWGEIGDVIVNPHLASKHVSFGMHGKVIGSFVCNGATCCQAYYGEGGEKHLTNTFGIDLKRACLTEDELFNYIIGKHDEIGTGWLWHISDLKIYDKPKELGEFYTICNKYGDDSCGDCPYLVVEQCCSPCDDCVDTWCSVDNIKPITRPPQSWCYVEELQ